MNKPHKPTIDISKESYATFLKQIKDKIATSQLKAVVAVNNELILLYWEIGKSLHQKQQEEGWGSKTIERLSKDIQNMFPGIEGFSRANIFRMKAFFLAYEKVAQAVRQLDDLPIFSIPWGHNVTLLQKLKGEEERLWYAQKTIENSWSRSVLTVWIESNLHKRQGKAITNFHTTLPSPQSDLAHQTLKDPYCFDFLTLKDKFEEKELEDGLIEHIQRFLLELGSGFSFVGRQVHLNIGDQDFYIDLLFYHLKLRAFFVVELKAVAFQPEHAGKMSFYLTAVDELMKHPDDQPTIGLLLCKTKNKVIAEYALRDVNKPIGVAEYETKIVESLPDNLKSSLPSIQELEEEFES